MTKDTQKEPVSVEEEIASLIQAGEDAENEAEDSEPESEDPETRVDDGQTETAEADNAEGDEADSEAEADESGDSESAESEDSKDTEPDDDEPETEDDLAASEGSEDLLEAPEHWAAEDRTAFESVPREGQEFLLKRHKEMEAHFTRKNQERADVDRQFGAIRDALTPHRADFERSGLDDAGAVRQLAHWHQALKSGGRTAILELAQTYGIDLSEPELDDTDPVIRSVRDEVRELKTLTARQQAEAQQREQQQLLDMIQAFETETDDSGALVHPHFQTLKDDITKLFQGGLATDLNDGYNKALALRPDLNTRKETKSEPVKEVDQAEKVKKAKRAATGVKSSGAVGKRPRKEMSLEEEIASHF